MRTWDLALAAIRVTNIKAGLTVEAVLHSVPSQTGWTVTNAPKRTLSLEPHAICPAWSYTLRGRQTLLPNKRQLGKFVHATETARVINRCKRWVQHFNKRRTPSLRGCV